MDLPVTCAFAPTLPLSRRSCRISQLCLTSADSLAARPAARRGRKVRASVVAAGTDGKKSGEKDSDEGTAGSDDPMAVPKFKFDPESEKDAFGRDPKKETDFWRGTAQELISSDEVQEAVKEFEQGGGEMSEEEKKRQEYLAFIASLDGNKEEGKGDVEPDA